MPVIPLTQLFISDIEPRCQMTARFNITNKKIKHFFRMIQKSESSIRPNCDLDLSICAYNKLKVTKIQTKDIHIQLHYKT